MIFTDIINKLIVSQYTLNIEEKGRRKLFIIFFTGLIITLLVFGTSNIKKGLYTLGIANYAAILLLVILIITLRFQKNGKIIYRATAILLELLLFYWTQTGVFHGYATIWSLTFPPFAFFLMGKKEGFFWTSICILFTMLIFINPYSLLTDYSYSPQFISRHLSVFFMIFISTYNYESVREKFKSAMEAEQAKLLLEKEKTEEVNRSLKFEITLREQTEIELRRHYDHLEEIVAERTAEIEKSREQLAQSQKMEALGTLVGGLAHDFNNFLAGVIGSFDLLSHTLKKENLNKKDYIEKYLKLGMESSKRSAGLIDQLLILSKKHEVRLSPLDIKKSLNHIYGLCRNSFPKSIEINFSTQEAPLVILGDPVQIEQVLLNLCINASHAMTSMRKHDEKQGGTLSVKTESVDSDYIMKDNFPEAAESIHHWIRIKVTDTGVGIDTDTRQRIFEPFFSTKDKKESSGLGLAITYNIIKKHSGLVNVYSEPGTGSCFSVYFPVYNDSSNISIDDAEPEIVHGTGTVLVIDDEPLILNIAEGFLERCGYDVITAEGAKKGIEVFRNNHAGISAVLLDLSMPDKSGLEVFQELKKIDADVKTILSSGMLDNELKDKALNMGVKETVNKPYMAAELSIKIKNIIG